jgi:hypothetical protein
MQDRQHFALPFGISSVNRRDKVMRIRILILVGLVLLIGSFSPVNAAGFGLQLGNYFGNAARESSWHSDTEFKSGIILGLMLEDKLTKSNRLRLRGELHYVRKGWKESGEIRVSLSRTREYSGDVTLEEMVVSVLLIVPLSQSRTSIYLLGGPEIGLNHSANADYMTELGNDNTNLPDWSKVNPGLNIGCGVEFGAGKGAWLLELRYNRGLSNLYKGSGSGLGLAKYEARTYGMALLAGYRFK